MKIENRERFNQLTPPWTIRIAVTGRPDQVKAAGASVERYFSIVSTEERILDNGLAQCVWQTLTPEQPASLVDFEVWLMAHVPAQLRRDPYWRSMLFIFQQQPYLKDYLTPEYFDFEQETAEIDKLRKLPISSGLAYLVDLALHLFNHHNALAGGLDGLGNLDKANYEIALKAIDLRYRGG